MAGRAAGLEGRRVIGADQRSTSTLAAPAEAVMVSAREPEVWDWMDRLPHAWLATQNSTAMRHDTLTA